MCSLNKLLCFHILLAILIRALLQAKRTADCVSMSNLDLCVLSAFDFKAVLKDFPHSAKTLKVCTHLPTLGHEDECPLRHNQCIACIARNPPSSGCQAISCRWNISVQQQLYKPN
eukprot:1159954-Pelagomonas_calceolata.AAC.13